MIQRDQNRIIFEGELYIGELLGPIAVMHQARVAGFEDLVLDFSPCVAAFAPPILALCSQVMKLRSEGVGFQVILPQKPNWQGYFEMQTGRTSYPQKNIHRQNLKGSLRCLRLTSHMM